MESLLPKFSKKDPNPGIKSDGFYTPHELTEEQKSRFLKYQGFSLPNKKMNPAIEEAEEKGTTP